MKFLGSSKSATSSLKIAKSSFANIPLCKTLRSSPPSLIQERTLSASSNQSSVFLMTLSGIKQIHLHFENCEENLLKKEASEKKYKFDDQELTINKIGIKVGIDPKTLQSRLAKGKTLEEAIKMGVSQKNKNIVLNGKRCTVSEFLSEFKIAQTTYYRNKEKYSLQELISKFSGL